MAEASAQAAFDVKSLLPDIKDILAHSDLNSVSAKSVRKELAARHPTLDVKAHKADIDELTLQCFSGTETPAPAKQQDDVKPVRPSPPTVTDTNSSPVKPLHAHATTSKLPAPAKREETDEEMARRLQAEFNGAASAGRRTRNAANGVGSSSSAGAKKSAKRRNAKSAATVSDGEDGPKKKRKVSNTGFNKPWALSNELADVCGEPVLSRPQVTKKLWEYIKRNDLQDPKKKVDVLTDDKLKRIFNNQNKVSSFGMAKFIGKHLYEIDPADIPAEMKSQDIINSEDEVSSD